MEQTIGTDVREKLVISFSIMKGKGIGLSKEIALMFREQKKSPKFFMTKQSYIYKFNNLHVKIYADKYLDSKLEIVIYKVDENVQSIVKDVLVKAEPFYINGEKNSIFLTSCAKFNIEDTEGLMTKLNERSKSEFCCVKEGNIYNISMNMVYNLKAESKSSKFEDSVFIRMPIQKGFLFLIPYIVPKIFHEKERIRCGVKQSMEEII